MVRLISMIFFKCREFDMVMLLKKHPIFSLYTFVVVCVSFYWLALASDRYVSETNIVLESPQVSAPALNFQSILSGTGSSTTDLLLLRDYLLSVDMLKMLDNSVGFAEHYSDSSIDFFSRLADKDAPIEELHDYYLNRIKVELDDYAHVLRIKVEAFEPNMAQRIAELLLSAGEQHMNNMGQRLAEEQVRFLESQLETLRQSFDKARQELIDYQNENGLVSPTGTVESLSAVVASLESQLANMRAKKAALLAFHSSKSSEIVKIGAEIKAINQQIDKEKSRMAQQSGGALNAVSSQYQTLELQMRFAQESYSGALSALQNTRIEAVRKLKQVSILQSPTLPEYSVEPRRVYNIAVFSILALFVGLIANMLILIVKDHRD